MKLLAHAAVDAFKQWRSQDSKVGGTTNQGVWRTEVPWWGPGSKHLVRAW